MFSRWMLAPALIAAAGAALFGCSPKCEPPAVQRPAATDTLAWSEGGFSHSVVEASLGDQRVKLLLDTAFNRTALTTSAVSGVAGSGVELVLGATRAGPLRVDLLMDDFGIDGVLGPEVLHQLPLRFDARARVTDVLADFEAPDDSTHPVELIASTACISDDTRYGAEGPFAFLVQGELEGQPATFLVDTGSDVSFVRTGMLDALGDRARLKDIPIASAFAAEFLATATRARTLKVGGGESPNALVLAAPAIDRELDRLGQVYSQAPRESGSTEIKVDGLLGWSFLREFDVTLTQGASATTGRKIGLARFDTQDHWQRHFVGIGIVRRPSSFETQPGIEVAWFYDPSPAKEAGLQLRDVITKVDGIIVDGDDPIVFARATANFEVQRPVFDQGQKLVGFQKLNFTVGYRDLVPDPE